MKALTTTAAQSAILLACAVFVGGCATGPRYVYNQESDSASILGILRDRQGQDDGSCVITIERVDGLGANFSASLSGLNWTLRLSPERLFLSPGTHTLFLDISETDPEYGSHSGNSVGIVGWTASGNKPTVTAAFQAKHTYRFVANLAGRYIELTLWDETSGASSRTEVQSWSLESNSAHSDQPKL